MIQWYPNVHSDSALFLLLPCKESIFKYVKQGLQREKASDFLRKEFPQYALSIWTLEGRLRNFGIYYNDDEVSIENVKEAVKKELEGPGSCNLRIQPFLLAPRCWGRGVRSLWEARRNGCIRRLRKEACTRKSDGNMTFLLREIKCDVLCLILTRRTCRSRRRWS